MNIKGNRHGQGTIIGAIFIILIIISGYTLFTVYNNAMTRLQDARSDILGRNFKKGKENLEFVYVTRNGTHEDLHIKNIGSQISRILYINDVTKYNFNNVTNEGIYLNPSEEINVSRLLSNVGINIPQNNTIQFLTELGNIYETKYDPLRKSIEGKLSETLNQMRKTLGDYLVDYHSFAWAEINGELTSEDWNESWVIPRNLECVYRINVTYYGDTSPVNISKPTLLNFFEIEKSATMSAWIVENTGNYNSESFEAYNADDPLTFTYNQTRTLYFAADSIKNPSLGVSLDAGTYDGSIIIFDSRGYSQSIPVIGVKAVK